MQCKKDIVKIRRAIAAAEIDFLLTFKDHCLKGVNIPAKFHDFGVMLIIFLKIPITHEFEE